MINVPFRAQFTAHQNIAEMTIYSITTALMKVALLFWMVNHEGNWFRTFIAWMYMFIILENVIMCLHAIYLYPECKFMRKYLWQWKNILDLTKFVSWQLFGNIGVLVRTQGLSLLVNKMFGAEMNATMGIANTVAQHSGKLEGGLTNALSPAINNLAGKGDYKGMLAMTYRFCRIGLCLTMVLVIPVFLERHELLTLLLKDPPALTEEATVFTLLILVGSVASRSCGIAVTAKGKIALYYSLLGSMNILSIPICWGVIHFCHTGFLTAFAVPLGIRIFTATCAAFLAKRLIDFSPWKWFSECLLPVFLCAAGAFAAGWICRQYVTEMFTQILTVGIVSAGLFLGLSLRFVLQPEEREYILKNFRKRFGPQNSKPPDCKMASWLSTFKARFRKWRQRWHFLRRWKQMTQSPRDLAGAGGLLLIPCDPWQVTGSRGDEAMLMVLAEQFQGQRVTCVTAIPEGSEAARTHGWEPLQCWAGYNSLDTIGKAVESLAPSACAILGADVMDGYYSSACSEQFLAIADSLRKCKIPTLLTGFSFNEHPSPRAIEAFQRVSEDFPFLLRDKISLERFERTTGCKGRLVADIAFLLKADLDTELYRQVQAWKHRRNRPLLALNLHPMLRFREGEEAARLLVEDAARLLTRVLHDNEWDLLLLPHDDRPKVADALSLRPLHEKLQPEFGERIFLCETPPNAAQLKGIVSLADALLTSRMHLGIAALSQGIPTAAFGYQGKFQGLFAHFELPETLLLKPPEKSLESKQASAVADFLANSQKYQKQILLKLPDILNKSLLNLTDLPININSDISQH